MEISADHPKNDPTHTGRGTSPAVLVTGLGAVSPIGIGVPSYIESLRSARSGISLLEFKHPAMKSTVAARATDFDPSLVLDPADLRRLPRHLPMALAAAREAMTQAGLLTASAPTCSEPLAEHTGLILGTGGGGIDFTLDQTNKMLQDKRASLWSVTNATHGNLAGELSIRLGLRGPSLCISTGCASSSDAVGLAMDLLSSDRPGSPRAMVVVGADAHIRWETLAGMEWLGVITTRDYRDSPHASPPACKPFDLHRDGFVLGEGAWAIVLQRPEQAPPEPLGEMLGYGSTCDAYHRVRPNPDMRETVRAIGDAMTHAQLTPADLGAIQYHGTATKLNDHHESQAIAQALGACPQSIPGSSIKGAIGHPQGACGLAALVAMFGALGHHEPFIPPTLNLRDPDPECPLDYTPLCARAISNEVAAKPFIVNCLAFGAKNSVLIAKAIRA